ncbi:MAG TPA: hypothetical protein VF175_02655 [Lacipirellula sp.]
MRSKAQKRQLQELHEAVAARTKLIEQQRQRAKLRRRARSLRTSLNRSNRRVRAY